MIRSIPLRSHDHGNLIDDEAWSSLVSESRSELVDAVLVTPPSGTYVSQASDIMPALRGVEGKAWFGLPGLEPSVKEKLREEDILWTRTADLVKELSKKKRRWSIVYEIIGEAVKRCRHSSQAC